MNSTGSRRWWALVALALSVLVVGLDLTVLNLALPTLAVSLHASASDLQWFVDAYSLVLAAALLPAGLLGDRYGRKKVLLGALVVFGAGSVACAYSGSAGVLIGARALLGLGAAAVFPLSLSVLPVLFTVRERPKAIGVVAGVTFLSYPIGPILGGWLLDNFWWGSVFLINVPAVAIAMIAVTVLMPESRGAHRGRVDVTGIVLSSAGLIGLTYGAITAGRDGWGSTTVLATIAAGALALAAFAAWEHRLSGRGGQPLVDLTLFRSASFTWGTILATLVSFALFGILFAMPQYFRDVRGLDSLASGFRLLPMIGGMLAGIAVSTGLQRGPQTAADGAGDEHAGGGRAGGRRGGHRAVGAKALVAPGFTAIAAGLAIGATTTVNSGTGFAATWFAIVGLGLGIAMPTAMNAALGALSAERSGVGSAVITAMRQVGATIGVAILGTVLISVYQSRLIVSGPPAPAAKAGVASGVAVAARTGSAALLRAVHSAFVQAMDVMLWVCGGIGLTAAVLALAFLPRHAGGAARAVPTARAADEIGV